MKSKIDSQKPIEIKRKIVNVKMFAANPVPMSAPFCPALNSFSSA